MAALEDRVAAAAEAALAALAAKGGGAAAKNRMAEYVRLVRELEAELDAAPQPPRDAAAEAADEVARLRAALELKREARSRALSRLGEWEARLRGLAAENAAALAAAVADDAEP